MKPSKQLKIFIALFILSCGLSIFIFNPEQNYLYFDEYKAADISNQKIGCNTMVSFSETPIDGPYRDINRYHYKNIHFFEKDTGYSFQSCRSEIDLNLSSFCSDINRFLTNHPFSFHYAETHYSICKDSIDEFYENYTNDIKIGPSTFLFSKKGKDTLLSIKEFSSFTKHKINFIDFWTLTIQLNNDYMYVLGSNSEVEIDNLISFIAKSR